jgi:hypothetical protein
MVTMQDIQHRALEQSIELAKNFSTPDSPLLVYRPPDQQRYFVTFKSCTEDYHPEWVVWPVEAA